MNISSTVVFARFLDLVPAGNRMSIPLVSRQGQILKRVVDFDPLDRSGRMVDPLGVFQIVGSLESVN